MSLDKFKNWVQKVPFLEESDCDLFADSLKIKQFSKKDWFLQAGQTCRQLGFVNQGAFRIYYISETGKEINTHFFFEDDFVADYQSFLSQLPSRYYIEAIESAELVLFGSDTLQKAYQQSHNWERFGRIMAERAYQLSVQRTESFLFMDGKESYLNLQNTRPDILDRVPLYHIASYLGLERESLSRLRKKIAGEAGL